MTAHNIHSGGIHGQGYGQGEAASYYASAQQQQQQYPPQGHHGQMDPQNDGPEGERGFLGAVGGGIAGAVGGNKIGGKVTGHSKTSTVIGAIAGAIAGHKLQDGVEDWKEDRKEEKEKKKREEEERKNKEKEEQKRKEEAKRKDEKKKKDHSPPRPREETLRNPNSRYREGYSNSSKDIRLDTHGEYLLHASCQRLDGSFQASTIKLAQYIENDQGSFCWISRRGNQHNTSAGPTTVTVQPGDTLRGIAARYGTTFEEIARLNNISNPDLIHPGQVFQIPSASNNNSGASALSSSNARNLRLVDGGSKLEGELLRDGRWCNSYIYLDEKIQNNNGMLVYVD